MEMDGNLESAFLNNPGQAFALEDVAEIEASYSSGTDEPDFVWLLRLKDGRYGVASGGHDYTGWD